MKKHNILTKLFLFILILLSFTILYGQGNNDVPIQVNIVLTHPAGYSPNVFMNGWIFGAYATAKIGNEPAKDISDQVRWSGSGKYFPATGPVSRPSFEFPGTNTIKLSVTVNGLVFVKDFTVNAVIAIGVYAAIGTKSYGFCAHGCIACPHAVVGPIITGSTNITINGIPAARKGDKGIHAACCGANTYEIMEGDPSVLINGLPAAKIGSKTQHCFGAGTGQIGRPPGGWKQETEQDCDVDNNEVWNEEYSTCVCADGYKSNKGQKCIEVEDCQENSHFNVNAFPTWGACECDEGYSKIYSLNDGKCYKIPECDESKNEVFDHWEGGCKCKDGYEENDEDECVPICNKKNNEVWSKQYRKCVCKDGLKMNSDGKCVTVCNEDNHEVWNDYWSRCECAEDYKPNLNKECIKEIDCKDNKKVFDANQNDCICNELEGYYPTEDPTVCSRFTSVKVEPDYYEGQVGERASFNILGIDQSGISVSIRTEDIKIIKVGESIISKTIDGHKVSFTIYGIKCDESSEAWNTSERRCDCKEDGFERNDEGKCIPKDEEDDEEEEEETTDECSMEYINSLSLLLESLIAETKQYESELISHINKFNKEINDQSSDPCKNSIIAYSYYSALRIAGILEQNISEIYDLAIDIIMLQETCTDFGEQSGSEGHTIESLVSNIDGIGSFEEQLNQMNSRLKENGCDEEEVEQEGEKVVPSEEDSGFLGDGGGYIEMPGDGDDNDGDGQQDEEAEALSGYNITLVLYDSGSAKDDVFSLSVTGYGNMGQTPAGGLRSYGLNLLPGKTYTATVVVISAPDNVGTYTLTVLFNGESIDSISGSPPQGSVGTLTFTVPSE